MLPFSYNKDDIELLPVEPNTLYAYWDYSAATWEELQQCEAKHLILILLSESNERHFIINLETKNYYFKGVKSNHEYQIQLACPLLNGFKLILESKKVTTPAKWPSENHTIVKTRFTFPKPPEKPGKPMHDWSAPINNFNEWLEKMSGMSHEELKASGFSFEQNTNEQSPSKTKAFQNKQISGNSPDTKEYKSRVYEGINNPSSTSLIKNKGGENA